MKQNKYDDIEFFNKYANMDRSIKGLAGAGEWHVLKKLLPAFKNKTVLDLGCGYGWHCFYAAQQEAKHIVGIDISSKMIEEAKKRNPFNSIEYKCTSIEEYNDNAHSFDIVLSSLAFHYLPSFKDICDKVSYLIKPGGTFVFSVEHPLFTASGSQDWYYDKEGNILHFPVDNYFMEGTRDANFLGENVIKYHKTLTTYINTLLQCGFNLNALIEPTPDPDLLESVEGMKDELRRPMMLIISATKKV